MTEQTSVALPQDNEIVRGITITFQMRKRAAELHAQIIGGTVAMMLGLKEMHDEKLYLALGFNSFKDYVNETLALSKSYAYELMNIVENFSADEVSAQLDTLGIAKMLELNKLPPALRRALFSGKAVEFPDGNTYTEAQVAELTAKALQKAMKKHEGEIKKQQEFYEEQIAELAKQRDEAIATGTSESYIASLNEQIKALHTELGSLYSGQTLDKRITKAESALHDVLDELYSIMKFANNLSEQQQARIAMMFEMFNTRWLKISERFNQI